MLLVVLLAHKILVVQVLQALQTPEMAVAVAVETILLQVVQVEVVLLFFQYLLLIILALQQVHRQSQQAAAIP
jgi:hypothetical protein